MVCATPRKDPRSEYFEFEVHPAARVVYTLRLDTHKNRRTLNLMIFTKELLGYKVHKIKDIKRANPGVNVNPRIFLKLGLLNSLLNNFKASANGCKIPPTPTLLGPFRSCAYPKTFRSNKVKKDIPNNDIKYTNKVLIKDLRVMSEKFPDVIDCINRKTYTGPTQLYNPKNNLYKILEQPGMR